MIQLGISTRIDGPEENESAGYDNFRITSHHDCGPCVPETVLISENFEDRWIDGWMNAKLDFSENFTYFLGRYDVASNRTDVLLDPVKVFRVPATATSSDLSSISMRSTIGAFPIVSMPTSTVMMDSLT